jgi:hypothetical protein
VVAVIHSIGHLALLPVALSEDAVDTLVDCIHAVFEAPSVPDWVKTIGVPGISLFESEISEAHAQIETARAAIVKLERWRQLLFEKDDALEDMVGDALTLPGLAPTKPPDDNDPDWMVDGPPQDLVIEVTGSDKIVPKSKMTQLLGWANKHGRKGLLIANPCRLTDSNQRDQRHLDELISQEGLDVGAKADLAVMLCSQLFGLVKMHLEGRSAEALSQFHNIVGQKLMLNSKTHHWERR